MAVVNKSSSDTGIGTEANAPLNAGAKVSFDQGFGLETWQVTKGSAWAYAAPYSVILDKPSHTSVVVDDMDPFDYER